MQGCRTYDKTRFLIFLFQTAGVGLQAVLEAYVGIGIADTDHDAAVQIAVWIADLTYEALDTLLFREFRVNLHAADINEIGSVNGTDVRSLNTGIHRYDLLCLFGNSFTPMKNFYSWYEFCFLDDSRISQIVFF